MNRETVAMSKFKKGDRVRVLDIPSGTKSRSGFTEFKGEVGKEGKITRLYDDGDVAIEYDDTGGRRIMDEDWLEYAEFTIDDIREFDIIEFRNGEKEFTWKNTDKQFETKAEYIDKERYSADLRRYYNNEYDIMKVYRPKDSLPLNKGEWKKLPIVYERKDVKEMTIYGENEMRNKMINCEKCRYRNKDDYCLKLDRYVNQDDSCSWGRPEIEISLIDAIDMLGELVSERIRENNRNDDDFTEENDKLEKAFSVVADKAIKRKENWNE